MNAPLPAAPRPRRFRSPGWWLLLLALAATVWLGWREYDHRAAVREAEAEFEWRAIEPIPLIRANWRAAFRKATWTETYRRLYVGGDRDLARLRPLLLRLRPTWLSALACTDANLDALKGLSSLKSLNLDFCTAVQNVDGLKGLTGLEWLQLTHSPALQNVDALKGLSGLQRLEISDCPALHNLDALKGLAGLQELSLSGSSSLQNVDALKGLIGLQKLDLSRCPALQNVDGIKGLSALQELDLTSCPQLPAAAVAELRAALPQTSIQN